MPIFGDDPRDPWNIIPSVSSNSDFLVPEGVSNELPHEKGSPNYNAQVDAVNSFVGDSSDSIMQSLLGAFGSGSSSEDLVKDLCMSLIEAMLNRRLQLDEREYNSVSQQYQRLEALGLSKSQIIQMLQGYASPEMSAALGNVASTSGLNQAQSFAAYTDSALSIASTAMQAVQLGFNAKGMLANSNLQAMYANQQQQAYNAVGQLQALMMQEDYRDGGIHFKDFSSIGDYQRALYGVSASDNKALYDFMHGSGFANILANPVATELMENRFNHHWSTAGVKNNDEVLASQYKRVRTAALLDELSIEQFRQEVKKNDLLIKQTFQDIETQDALRPYVLKKAEKEVDLLSVQVSNARSQGEALNLANRAAQRDEDWYLQNIDKINVAKLGELADRLALGTYMSEEGVQKMVNNIAADEDNRLLIAQLAYMHNKHGVDFMNENPNFSRAWDLTQEYNLVNFIFGGDPVDKLSKLFSK